MSGTMVATTGTTQIYLIIWNALVVPIRNAEAAIMAAMQGYVTTWFAVAVSAYLMASLLRAALTPGDEGVTWLFRQIFLASVVYSLAALSAYSTYAVGIGEGLVTHVNNAIVGVFGGTPVTGADAFDVLANQMFAVGAVTMKHLPWYAVVKGLGTLFIVVIFLLNAEAAILVMFVLYMLSSVIVGFLLAFGPLFVACYFFPFTRQFFDGWLRTLVSGMLTQIFIVGLSALFSLVVSAAVAPILSGMASGASTTGGETFFEIVSLIELAVTCFAFVFLAIYIARLAQSIGGGAHAQFIRLPFARGGKDGGSGGGGSGDGSSGGGGGSGAGSGTGQPPPRSYPFSRSVGGAS